MAIGFDLGHDLDLECSRPNMQFAISQYGPIATKRKANISIDLKASNVNIGFDLGPDIDADFSGSNKKFAIPLQK